MLEENSILNSILKEFKEKFKIQDEDDKLFEYFSGYILAQGYCRDDISEPAELNSGGGTDQGIDALAIIINGKLVASHDKFMEIYEASSTLDVKYIFVQAKNVSNSKNSVSYIANFISGIKTTFTFPKGVPEGKRTKYSDPYIKFVDLKNEIEACDALGSTPEIYAYFVNGSTDGSIKTVRNEQRVIKSIESFEKEYKGYKFHFELFDAHNLLDLNIKIQNRSQAKFNASTLQLYKGNGITPQEEDDNKNAKIYFGYLPLGEYLEIINDPDGMIKENVFYENVRSFKGDTRVNKSIKESLQNSSNHSLFFARNNGVTITARKAVQAGDTLQIKDYNVVNGCQTSYILSEYYKQKADELKNLTLSQGDPSDKKSIKELYNLVKKKEIKPEEYIDSMGELLKEEELLEKLEREKDALENIKSSICIPVRIIESLDDDLVSSIIQSTNTQNNIFDLNLEARKTFHKHLEVYFKGKDNGQILYERLEGSVKDKKQKRIKTDFLMRSFATLYYWDANLAARSPGSIKKYIGETDDKNSKKNKVIFSDESHSREAYYFAAKMCVDLMDYIKISNFDGDRALYNKNLRYKWHILYAMLIELQEGMPKSDVKGCSVKIEHEAKKLAEDEEKLSRHLEMYNKSNFKDLYTKAYGRLESALESFMEDHTDIDPTEISKNRSLMNYITKSNIDDKRKSPKDK